ncbi:MAG: tetraacyldisaccharide 4'-kinase, partial [Candidatus Zixiibacteriota bacterium]
RVGLSFSRALTPAGPGLRVPVISVGALTLGGAGKTPFVAALLESLLERGVRVGVVGSGYGRQSARRLLGDGRIIAQCGASVAGDELAELAARFPRAWFSVSITKRAAAEALAATGEVDVLLIDDGFQTRGLQRDLDVLLISAESKPGEYRLAPAGKLREPLAALARADAVVYTKLSAETASPEAWLTRLVEKHIGERAAKNTFAAWNETQLRPVYPHAEAESNQEELHGPALVAVGLADNTGFLRSAERSGADIRRVIEFDDHFPYDAAWAARLRAEIENSGCAGLLTSAKDWSKLKEYEWGRPVWELAVRTRAPQMDRLLEMIENITVSRESS